MADTNPLRCEKCGRTVAEHGPMLACTNPLREKLADAVFAMTVGMAEPDESVKWGHLTPESCRFLADALIYALAEFIGDGLLDANGQRWTKRETDQYESCCADGAYGPCCCGRADRPLFVLERSETDQEGQ